jgi:hypothetical protein
LSPDIEPPHTGGKFTGGERNKAAAAADLIDMKGEILVLERIFDLGSLSGVFPPMLPDIKAANPEGLAFWCGADELPGC